MPTHARAGVSSAGPQREDAVGGGRDVVRDQDLLAEADDEAPDARGEVVEADHAAGELVGDLAVADDRPGNELREQQHVERRVNRALLRARVAAVDVDHVRNRVERVERDADRQQHLRDGERSDAQSGEQRVDVVGEEVRVLEDAEHGKVDADGDGQPASRPGVFVGRAPQARCDRYRHPVVERDRRQHQPGERAASPRVEQHARADEQDVRILAGPPLQEVQREQDRKEEEEERGLGEEQG